MSTFNRIPARGFEHCQSIGIWHDTCVHRHAMKPHPLAITAWLLIFTMGHVLSLPDAYAQRLQKSDLGSTLVNADGLTLYVFDNDSDGTADASDNCPATVNVSPQDRDGERVAICRFKRFHVGGVFKQVLTIRPAVGVAFGRVGIVAARTLRILAVVGERLGVSAIAAEVAAGDLVPIADVLAVLDVPLTAATRSGGWILDGAPRTVD